LAQADGLKAVCSRIRLPGILRWHLWLNFGADISVEKRSVRKHMTDAHSDLR